MAMPIYYATGSKPKAFFWASLSGMTELFGAALGWVVLRKVFNQLVYGILFGLISGMMVRVRWGEGGWAFDVSFFVFVCCGWLVCSRPTCSLFVFHSASVLRLWLLLFVACSPMVSILPLLHASLPPCPQVYIALKELLPTAHRYDPEDKVVTISLIGGMIIMAASLVLFLF